MSGPPLRLKQSSGWFAAGREFAQALALLSDGAFKVYVYACLQADRHTGRFQMQLHELARALQRRPQSVLNELAELKDRAVCDMSVNAASGVALEVRDRFWPYHKQITDREGGTTEVEFVHRVRQVFLAPACVQSSFTAADEKIAVHLHRRGLSLQQVQRAILLGCARKYVSAINHGVRQPITSLQYFLGIVDEVVETASPESYWEYLRRTVARMEQSWKARQN